MWDPSGTPSASLCVLPIYFSSALKLLKMRAFLTMNVKLCPFEGVLVFTYPAFSNSKILHFGLILTITSYFWLLVLLIDFSYQWIGFPLLRNACQGAGNSNLVW